MIDFNIKAAKFYVVFVLLVIIYFSYANWNGITFWEDAAERNTEYNSSNHSHSGYGARFYHK